MKTLPVIACAISRLHADVIVIRLRRVGVAKNRISALCNRRHIPNSVACWLSLGECLPFRMRDDALLAAGKLFTGDHNPAKATSIEEVLQEIGVDRAQACDIGESLLQGNILICVHAADEAEASLAWHVFDHAKAEKITLSEELPELVNA